MFNRCAACGSLIIVGGNSFLDRRCCNADCLARFQTTLAEEVVSEEEVDEQARLLFEGPCPECGWEGGNDMYSATRVTGFLFFAQIKTQQKQCCAGCGRKNRLLAALYCLVCGWWGPKAAICNLFVLPMNLIAAAFIRTPSEPSAGLRQLVKIRIAESLEQETLAHQTASATVWAAPAAEPGAAADGGGRTTFSGS
jgi:hypothetical protein